MRRWARTRFIPDDWGLNPPIDTLPHIAQERAMLSSETVVTGTPDLEGDERGGMIAPPPREPPDVYRHRHSEVAARVPTASTPGRSIVSRRAVIDIVRTATLGSYGVTGFAGGILGRLLERFGFAQPGIHVSFDPAALDADAPAAATAERSSITVDLDLTVAYGVPIAEVARQVDSAVRYALKRALDRDIARLTVHVDGLSYQPGDLPAPPAAQSGVRSDDLAASGTDVA
jgi:uncharacterized alkaline shock family protein YloU